MANEERLNELDPDKWNSYEKLKHENIQLLWEINNIRAELDNINMALSKADAALKADTLR